MYPFHSEDERDYFAWLGLYVTLWSHVDEHLSTVIELLFRFFNGGCVHPQPPINLTDKTRFLRRAANKLSKLHSERSEIDALTAAIDRENKFRAMLVHGTKVTLGVPSPHAEHLSKPAAPRERRGARIEMAVNAEVISDKYEALGHISFCLMGLGRRLNTLIEGRIAELERRLSDFESTVGDRDAALAEINRLLDELKG